MKIGVLGAGQLGRMMGLAGMPLGLQFYFLGTGSEPALPGELLDGAMQERGDVARLAELCDVLTYETEHIPADYLQELPGPVTVYPPVEAVATAQDRLRQKEFLSANEIPLAPFLAVDGESDLPIVAREFGYPFVLKTRRHGYDGRGQFIVRGSESHEEAWKALSAGAPLVAERFIPFEAEASIVCARGRDGVTVFYPLVKNVHEDGILIETTAPAPDFAPALTEQARDIARRILEAFGYVGVLTVEFFVTGDGLLVNEYAPRVHNSGHWTIEGAETSQFENHVRAIAGLPLGDTAVRSPSRMFNLIGRLPSLHELLQIEGVHPHLYGKSWRPGRKLGHVTVTAPDNDVLQERAAKVARLIDNEY